MAAQYISVFLFVCSGIMGNPCSLWTGGRYFDGYCYFISTTTMAYLEAKASCTRVASTFNLAEPRTELRLSFLRDLATQINLNTNSATGILLGGTRDTRTAEFLWSNGDILPWKISSTQSEDCLQMMLHFNLTLSDVSCDLKDYYACEQYIGDPCEAVLSGSEFFGGSCFKLHNEIGPWNNAMATCRNEGGYLAEPSLLKFMQFLSRVTPYFMKHTYIVVVPRKTLQFGSTLAISTTFRDDSAFYTVSQYMTSITSCPALDQLISDVSVALEPHKWIRLDPRIGTSSSGISREHVLIRSTRPLTVVLYAQRNILNPFDVVATLIYPAALLGQNYFLSALKRSNGQVPTERS